MSDRMGWGEGGGWEGVEGRGGWTGRMGVWEGGREGGRREGRREEERDGWRGRERGDGKRRGSDGGERRDGKGVKGKKEGMKTKEDRKGLCLYYTLCLSHCHATETNLALFHSALHLAIIHNHQDVVLQLLDVLPQLPPTETPVVDCVNNFKQVSQSVSLQCHVWQSCCIFQTHHLHI